MHRTLFNLNPGVKPQDIRNSTNLERMRDPSSRRREFHGIFTSPNTAFRSPTVLP